MTTSYEEARATVETRLESLNAYNAMLAKFDMPATTREISVPVASLRALLAGPPEREGWVLVPREPTDEMVKEAREQDAALRQQGFNGAEVEGVWTAMLSAAPKP